ncbi:MAG: EamA family transporter, partial [Rhodospirillales bacterium]|nr:EamA family transporter [Rhodospirillales bacterium]
MEAGSDHVKGLALTLGAVLILSPDVLIIRLIETDRATLLWWRGLLMATGLVAYLALRYRRAAVAQAVSLGRLGLLAAALFTCSTYMFVTSATLTTAANTLVIVSSAPLFAAVFSRAFLKELVPPRTWIAVIVAVIGIGIIFAGSMGGGTLRGNLCALASACALAGYLVVTRHARARSMIPALALSGVIVAAIVAPLANPLSVTGRDMGLLLLLGLLIMPIS